MALNVFSITCPTSCETALVTPALPADMCQKSPIDAEIDLLLLQGSDDGPTDASSGAAWTPVGGDLIDNTDTTGAKFHYLIGRGSIAASEPTVVQQARGEEGITKRTFTMVFEVLDISEALTYDFLRTLQCGSTKPRIMYASRGGWLYCKKGASSAADNGITIKSLSVDFPKELDGGDKAVITIKWESKTDPDRMTNPLTI